MNQRDARFPDSDKSFGVQLNAVRGSLNILLERLSGPDGDNWLRWLQAFNLRQNPWPVSGVERIDERREVQHPPEKVILRAKDAAAYIGISPSTLAKWRLTGQSPPYLKFGSAVMYKRTELDAWIAARTQRSTSDTPENRASLRKRRT